MCYRGVERSSWCCEEGLMLWCHTNNFQTCNNHYSRHKKDKVYNATHHNKLRKRSSTTRYIYIHIYSMRFKITVQLSESMSIHCLNKPLTTEAAKLTKQYTVNIYNFNLRNICTIHNTSTG